MAIDLGPLGRTVEQQPIYSPDLLFRIERKVQRALLGLTESQALPFVGADRWTAWELSWLDARGKPEVAVLRIVVPIDGPYLIESKSLKLYLNSYARERGLRAAQVQARIAADLSAAVGAPVEVDLLGVERWPELAPQIADGECIDALEVDIPAHAQPSPDLLRCDAEQVVAERLHTHLLKSNCPVTGQPDWATLCIDYRGPRLERAALLAYLISYREHQAFHEQCVEQIFLDLTRCLHPQFLALEARYTRRGGLDINPYRASAGAPLIADRRLLRQ